MKLWAEDCETSLHEHGHSYSGEIGMLQGKPEFIDKMYSTEREAEDYISEHHEKWRRPLAVSFSGTDGVKHWVIGGWCSS